MTPFDAPFQGIIEHFKNVPDPRIITANNDHLMIDIIVISVCAVIAGADGPTEIAQWGVECHDHLKRYLELPNGIPSHDTFNRVLSRLKPTDFQNCFVQWIDSLRKFNTELREHVAIDGKAIRASKNARKKLGPLHIVSAFSTENGISLGQIATEEKSNEITAIPELLDQIDVKGAVITIDAIATQTKIVTKVVELDADYIIGVKDNQKKLHQGVKELFQTADLNGRKVGRFVEDEKSHGRIEHREYYQMLVPNDFPLLNKWTGLRSVIMTIRTHIDANGKSVSEMRYFISSLGRDIKLASRCVRRHWGIENSLHWVLDVAFREDVTQIENRNLGDNLSWMRRFAVTLIKQNERKGSIKGKRKRAGWNFSFLMELLFGL